MPKSRECAASKHGHFPMDGWDPGVQTNTGGFAFIHRVCRNCHCVYIEFLRQEKLSGLVDIEGQPQVATT